jgi:hypothetical protein
VGGVFEANELSRWSAASLDFRDAIGAKRERINLTENGLSPFSLGNWGANGNSVGTLKKM